MAELLVTVIEPDIDDVIVIQTPVGPQAARREVYLDARMAFVTLGLGRRPWSTRLHHQRQGLDWTVRVDLLLGLDVEKKDWVPVLFKMAEDLCGWLVRGGHLPPSTFEGSLPTVHIEKVGDGGEPA